MHPHLELIKTNKTKTKPRVKNKIRELDVNIGTWS